ncbi:bifunctional hydroxymethylpyrimidine kinase/phosphomethylpyrimidine kinase [Ideonella livida]|uniref:hydroxymethylpyrimidine kinase n=1 Tax=Ideonella livida TaxID=2707176 RepID=A0A7C9TMX1_9BURK|nr:bifunctional hydroxymethylpyrimidine kinase/phosphomethylpyrimidine kinase [Ideonella livida]NDY92006.1 hypothetical protein [Ideonella livida]
MAMPQNAQRPLIWSIAGTDSGGGAGLAADQRAAEACGVDLCPVVAAVTAQNSVAVSAVHPVPAELLQAQLDALAADMPPRVIKTGLLGSAAAVQAVARTVDALRQRGPVALVVDPVLRATVSQGAGTGFADDATLAAYRELLLPRTTVLTPNRREAARLLGQPEARAEDLPAQAEALRALGVHTVVATGGDSAEADAAAGGRPAAHDWLASAMPDGTPITGWLSAPRVPTAHHHGTGCTFASTLAAALARGFVPADAAVLAKMATTAALRAARPRGAGAGPVWADAGFITDPSTLPWLTPGPALPVLPVQPGGAEAVWPPRGAVQHATGLYAIVDRAERVQAVLAAAHRLGLPLPTLQLRIKRPAGTAPDDAAWLARLRADLAQGLAAAGEADATLYINDHWQLALDLGAQALHLGQEDLLALSPAEQQRLRSAQASGLKLGLSSHTLWELCRAAAWQPAYIACGPVWPTTTKDMPWVPQGLDNLGFWARMAPAPAVGIGGVLAPTQLSQIAASGAQGGCIVRGLGEEPVHTLPAWQHAWDLGRATAAGQGGPMGWPHASLTAAA